MEDSAEHLTAVVLVGVGGFAGALARYAVDLAAPALPWFAGLPAGTLVVNVAGAFALGALTSVLGARRVRLLVATGGLSSFTTYSTFAVETATLDWAHGAGYVAATFTLGFFAAWAGLVVGRRSRRRRRGRRASAVRDAPEARR